MMDNYIARRNAESQKFLEIKKKSQSLPSYAKPGGEGLDYKAIFEALEQQEKRLKKCRSFKEREGGKGNNYFCFPLLSTKSGCKETSLSSDTSCSSLEFHRPRSGEFILKGWQRKELLERVLKSDSSSKPSKMIKSRSKSVSYKSSNIKRDSEFYKNMFGSSDSCEKIPGRSSRSSNESVSRKERLEAVKAKVEAERERYESSTDEEIRKVRRPNIDGVVSRPRRESRSRSARTERYLKRKSQEDDVKMAIVCDMFKMEETVKKPLRFKFEDKSINSSSLDNFQKMEQSRKQINNLIEINHLSDQKISNSLKNEAQKNFQRNITYPNAVQDEKTNWQKFYLPTYREMIAKPAPLPSRQTIPQVQKTKLETLPSNLHYHMLTVATAAPSATETTFQTRNHLSIRDSGISSMASASSVTRAPTPPPRSSHSRVAVNEAYQHMQDVPYTPAKTIPWLEPRNPHRYKSNSLGPSFYRSGDYRSKFSRNLPAMQNALHKDIKQENLKESLFSTNKDFSLDSIKNHLLHTNLNSENKVSLKDKFLCMEKDKVNDTRKLNRCNYSASTDDKSKNPNSKLEDARDIATERLADSLLSRLSRSEGERTKFSTDHSMEASHHSDMDSWMKWRCLPRRKQPVRQNIMNVQFYGCNRSEAFPDAFPESQLSTNSNPKQNSYNKFTNRPYSLYNRNSDLFDFTDIERSFHSTSDENIPTHTKFKNNQSDSELTKRLSSFTKPENSVVKCDKKDSLVEPKKGVDSLETAMEELEKVYRSLGIDNDSCLKDTKSTSHIKLNPPSSSPVFRLSSHNSLENNSVKGSNQSLVRSRSEEIQAILENNNPVEVTERIHELSPPPGKIVHSSSCNIPSKLTSTKDISASRNVTGSPILTVEAVVQDLANSIREMNKRNLFSYDAPKNGRERRNSCTPVKDGSDAASSPIEMQTTPTTSSGNDSSRISDKSPLRDPHSSDKENMPKYYFNDQKKNCHYLKYQPLASKKKRATRSQSANLAHLMDKDGSKSPFMENEKTQSMSDILAVLRNETTKKIDDLLSTSNCVFQDKKTSIRNDSRDLPVIRTDYANYENDSVSPSVEETPTAGNLLETSVQSSDGSAPLTDKEIWQVRVAMANNKSTSHQRNRRQKHNAQLHSTVFRSRSSPPPRHRKSLPEMKLNLHPDTSSDSESMPKAVTPLNESQLDELLWSLDRDTKALTNASSSSEQSKSQRPWTSMRKFPLGDNLEGEVHGLNVRA